MDTLKLENARWSIAGVEVQARIVEPGDLDIEAVPLDYRPVSGEIVIERTVKVPMPCPFFTLALETT